MKRMGGTWIVAAGLLLGGCGVLVDDGIYEDTTGVVVTRRDGMLVGDEGPVVCSGTSPVEAEWRFGGSHLLALCGTPTATGSTSGVDCRALRCTSDADCPYAPELARIVCEEGLCALPDQPLRDEDVVIRCIDDAPRLTDCADALTQLATLGALVGSALERHCDGSGLCTGPITCGE